MDSVTAEIMLNPEIIAINQDALGRQARRVAKDADLEVWHKPLVGNAHAVALLNRSDAEAEIELRWRDIGLLDRQPAAVRNLWLMQDVGESKDKFSMTVPAHGTAMLRLNL